MGLLYNSPHLFFFGVPMLTNPSRLLERNIEELASAQNEQPVTRLLIAYPPADSVIELIKSQMPETEIAVLTNLVPVQQQAIRTLPAENVVCSHDLQLLIAPVDQILLYLQKSRPFNTALLDQLCPMLTENGRILLVGEKGEGIKSWRKHLQKWGEVNSIANGCHSGLLELLPDTIARQADKQEWPEERFAFDIAGTGVDVISLPGVFSHGRLDAGTSLLLETLSQENIRGQVLDFGCGAGVIGSWLANRHHRCRPTLLDVDAMALEASRRTLRANGIEGGKIIAGNGLQGLTGRYDWIISNPPFHEGVKTRYDVTEALLLQAKAHLARGGQLRIVANSFLRYQPLIEEAFGHCEILAQGCGFTIYGATLASKFIWAKIDNTDL